MTPSPSRRLRLTPAGIAATLAVAIVAVGCVRLGFWQLDRLEQRRQMNAALAERMSIPAVDLEQAPTDTTGLLLRTVHVRGTFDHAHSIIRGGRSRAGSPGVHLLTPLRLEETTEPILVNRGWLPSADAASIDLAQYREPGLQELTGIVMPLESSVDDDAATDAAAGETTGFRTLWFRLEAEPLLAQFPYPLPPIYVQALPEENSAGASPADDGRVAGEAEDGRAAGEAEDGPAPGAVNPPRTGGAARPGAEEPGAAEAGAAQPRTVRPEQPMPIPRPELDEGPHLGYAIQWFSFAAIAVIGWLVLVAREEGANGGDHADSSSAGSGE